MLSNWVSSGGIRMDLTSMPRLTTRTLPCHRARSDLADLTKDVSPARLHEQAAASDTSSTCTLWASENKSELRIHDMRVTIT